MISRVVFLSALTFFGVAGLGPAAAEDWDHVHLVAPDTQAAAEWYAAQFGGEVTKSGRFDAVLFGTNLVKFRKGGPEVAGNEGSAVDHVAFSVQNVKGLADTLREAGLKVGAPNRRTQTVVWLEDPWGTKIELLQDPDLEGFHHVHLKSQDPQGTAQWYAKTFGGEVGSYKNVPNLKAVQYGDMWLLVQRAVRPVTSTEGRSVDHIGWLVDDFDATVERLKRDGVTFLLDPTQSGDHRVAFIEGPDGVKIEVVEPSPK